MRALAGGRGSIELAPKIHTYEPVPSMSEPRGKQPGPERVPQYGSASERWSRPWALSAVDAACHLSAAMSTGAAGPGRPSPLVSP